MKKPTSIALAVAVGLTAPSVIHMTPANAQPATTRIDCSSSNNTICGLIAAPIPTGSNLIGDVNLRQGGTALSTTNGAYFNQLQGNAALSATNPTFSRLTDGTNPQVMDPCQTQTKVNFTGSQTSNTKIITGTSAKKTYICSMQLIVQGAETVSVVEGSSTTCGSSTVAVLGSTTASLGMAYAANGGFTWGNGQGTVMFAGTTNANDVCIYQSSSQRVVYGGTYVQQ